MPSQKVIRVLNWIEKHGCPLFKEEIKYAENVRDKEVADYLIKKGFTVSYES